MKSAACWLRGRSMVLRSVDFSKFEVRYSLSSTAAGVRAAAGDGGGGGGKDPYVPVLIVGAGPVGLVLSFLLTKLEVKCAVLEKSTIFSRHPQAHFINNRSMELFRKLDGLATEIQRLQPPVDLWRKFIYCTSLSGSILGSVDHIQPQDFEKIISPISVAHFSQYKLVRLLLEKLENIGFQSCTSNGDDDIWEKKILMGHECIGIEDTADGITVGASFQKDGKAERRNFRCDILVGSDGAGSAVRKLVGINLKGERDMQKLISVHFVSRDLGRHLLQLRPGMLFFIFNPNAIGVLVAHDLNQGEFVLQMPYYPPQQKLEDFHAKVCEQIIVNLVGRKLADIEVLDIKPWVMHAEVAEKFVSCHDRVILVGDAAHRFPPAGGFGMNTGIQDAHNLAWKIKSLLDGLATPTILRTYELERRPISIANTELSVQNFKSAMSVPAALGLDPKIANLVHQVINGDICSMLPSELQKGLLEGIFSMGRAQLSSLLLNESNPLGSFRISRLKNIFEEGKSLQLQFPAEDLGFRYSEGALVAEADKNGDGVEAERPKGGPRLYVPSAKPGSRLPHMQIRELKSTNAEDSISTLDLIPGDRLEFLLIIAPEKESYNLARAAVEVARGIGLSLKVCVMWPQGSSPDGENNSEMQLKPWNDNYMDVEEVRTGLPPLSWWEICGMTSEGVILVRPDDHVAWRTRSAAAIGNPSLELETVFSRVFGKGMTPL